MSAQRKENEDSIRGVIDASKKFGPPPDPVDLECARFDKNDIGNSDRLLRRHGEDLIYVRGLGWHVWSGSHWDRSNCDLAAELRAQETARRIYEEASALKRELQDSGKYEPDEKSGEDKRVTSMLAWARESGNRSRVSAMQALAAARRSRSLSELDADPYLFNCRNCTLRLCADSEIERLEHTRDHLITKRADVEYDEDADYTEFAGFLRAIQPDTGMQVFLQAWFGYSLTGSIQEQKFVMFLGVGSNGKSTLVDLLQELVGDYAMSLPFASLLHDDKKRGSEASPDLARLPGARIVAAAEPDLGARFSESTIKEVTGGTKIAARKLREDFFEFKPEFKLVLSGNSRPRIVGQDEGIWRRVLLVPFEHQFVKENDPKFGHLLAANHPNVHLRDDGLPNRLRENKAGILNWMLDGYRVWRERGLEIPDAVLAETQNYREESDPVGQFLEQATERKRGSNVTAKRLYDAYLLWCKSNAASPVTTTAFGRILVERGIQKEKVGVIYYKDLTLLPDYDPDRMGLRDDVPPHPGAD